MYLPQELLDQIFTYFPLDDLQSLRSCSLVSKSWLEPSRRLLFAHVLIDATSYQSWLDKISPKNTGLLYHVRSLTYFQRRGTRDPRCRASALCDYFPSFCKLKILTFRGLSIEPNLSLEMFSAFQHTLSSLQFMRVSIPWSAFVAVLGWFPNVRTLSIRNSSFQADGRPVTHIHHPLRGMLIIDSSWCYMGPFIDRFPTLKQEYEELVVFGRYDHRLVAAVEASLKSLKIHRCKVGTTPDLSRLTELCQLEFTMVYPREQEQILISSITSTNLQKVTFTLPTIPWGPVLSNSCWISFENMICGLADRLRALGSRNTLQVEFRVGMLELSDEEHHRRFLPKFREKGRVRVVSAVNDEVQEW